MKIKPHVSFDMLEPELESYDLVLMSPPMAIRQKMSDEYVLQHREKWVLICQKAPKNWYFDHTERLNRTLPIAVARQLTKLATCAGSIAFKKFPKSTVVEITQAYMRERMGLSNVVKDVALTPPAMLLHRRFDKRVVISPDSSGPEKKNWTPDSFLKLARVIRERGYAPVIVVAPSHHEEWVGLVNGEFDVPLFPGINQLASFIYESGAVVANDSGNGHLASFLNVPILTIYRKRNKKFHWRPGWGKGAVVCPLVVLPGRDGGIWKPFVTPARVLASLERLLKSHH
ncbi:hypothetical protein LG201_06730 [Methylobacillus gramineus]|uniref:glycosyltransferase family 9 protein n=1 Tax=Methylobacillus gramineus TaxID=755169 RepID=UPI001CFFBEED|nr:glycosyltransferase family 9 protein [Methylobacillus gramineus]MCB5184896.1 hypothetical protein [Methylobacillus gramineus]